MNISTFLPHWYYLMSILQVTLLSGSVSGHVPTHTGYVGHGMLSRAVAFAPPLHKFILATLKAVRRPRGTPMIVRSYTGDQLNSGIAFERVRSEGMKVIGGENCTLPSTGNTARRRGLCGSIPAHKVGKLCDYSLNRRAKQV